MERPNDEHLPFIRFPDAASWERHHDNRITRFCCNRVFVLHMLEEKPPAFYARLMEFEWAPLTKAPPDGVDIPLNATVINEVLELPDVPNVEFEAKLREMDLEWLKDTIVEPTRRDQVATVGDPKDPPVGQPHGRDLSSGSGGGVCYTGNPINCGGADHLRVEDVLPGGREYHFSTPMRYFLWIPPFHPLLVRQGSTSRSKRRRTGRASSSKATVDSKKDLEAVWKRMGSAYADFTSVPPNTAIEVGILCCQVRQERNRNLTRDRLMIRL
ncbi:hypothetical protein KY290_017318 [Solanum tuberosum]|uniref:Integrase core domain containing protein n=1 Tax=Solanum tuberosum TaxID=4113 RepID=A0ABQ7VDV4_SOLTU|nr:hypothetical protein KY284_016335 [Solanum tuberosum]KAH0702062.1 hypothetical protein KY285_016340 [Solanum tuberosum]KAH0761245.1 hypothetical protein KY290_017318 [Solanum tuberosum]